MADLFRMRARPRSVCAAFSAVPGRSRIFASAVVGLRPQPAVLSQRTPIDDSWGPLPDAPGGQRRELPEARRGGRGAGISGRRPGEDTTAQGQGCRGDRPPKRKRRSSTWRPSAATGIAHAESVKERVRDAPRIAAFPRLVVETCSDARHEADSTSLCLHQSTCLLYLCAKLSPGLESCGAEWPMSLKCIGTFAQMTPVLFGGSAFFAARNVLIALT